MTVTDEAGRPVIASSFVVLLLWVPLRQWPGLGTVLNAVVIGVAIDLTLLVVPAIEGLGWRVFVMLAAVLFGFWYNRRVAQQRSAQVVSIGRPA